MRSQHSNIKILIADDELNFYQAFRQEFAYTYEFNYTSDPQRILEFLQKEVYDVMLLDLSFNGKSAYDYGVDEILPQVIEKVNNKFPVIIATNDTRDATYQRVLEKGARGLLKKIEYNPESWNKEIRRIITEFHQEKENNSPKLSKEDPLYSDGFISLSPKVLHIKKQLQKYVQYKDVPILILGETGVGKEVAAKYIHYLKGEKKIPFFPINLISLNEQVFESEIFGHLKGSFTGATSDKMGLFEEAKGGILFLDEIGEISLEIQVKLLRVLEEKKFRKVGSTKYIDLDVHLIFATNNDLENAILKGTFRRDFYERISALTIVIPPLRERKEDIIPLLDFFLQQENVCPIFNSFHGLKAQDIFDRDILSEFENYNWPGNIRELRNVLQKLVIEADFQEKKLIEVESLPLRFRGKANRIISNAAIEEPSREENSQQALIDQTQWNIAKQTAYEELKYIEKALIDCGGRKDDAAKKLGLKNDQTLRYKVKMKFYLECPELFEFFPSVCKAYKLEPGFDRALNIFICYSRQNKDTIKEIRKQLSNLEGSYPLRIWYDNEIAPGEKWDNTIRQRLEISDIFILLICADFLVSQYIIEVELEEAMKKHAERSATIIPIITKPCNWKVNKELSSLQALPENGRAITLHEDRDSAYLEVIEGVERTIKKIYQQAK